MMKNICKNCGNEIRVMIFKGGDWCSDYCRKVLLGKVHCSYENIWIEEVDANIDVCIIHGFISKYGPTHGPNRPCIAVEPVDDWDWEDQSIGM